MWLSVRALSFVFAAAISIAKAADDAFENTAVVRTVDLGGSLVYVSTTYAVKALKDGASEYAVVLSENDFKVTSWIEARVKGAKEALPMKYPSHSASKQTYEYVVELPSMKDGDSVNLQVDTVQTHATYPWPASVGQTEAQDLKYTADLFVISPYSTKVQRSKVKAPSKVHEFTTPSNLADFTSDPTASKSSSTVTYGPYNNVPPSANADFQKNSQQRITVYYEFNEPVFTVISFKRSAELSHWGSNLNIQDDIQLRNDGPKLKGQFSRLEYQMQKYRRHVTPHTVESINLHLPAGIHSPYYFDLNGNVSTSRFRPSPPVTKATKSRANQYSVLSLRPRYPLLGGWNYTFTLGWDAPLADSVKWDAKEGKYIVAVPFWTPIPGAVVDEAEVSIILPEGATDVKLFTPFYPPITANRTTHVTYLDTIGRPKVVLTKSGLTDRHTEPIYVSYKLPFTANLRKPIAIAVGTFGLFMLSLITRRIDPRIHK